ncbi:MAG: hypothetical protein E7037_00685 [Verrucomicrobia bacterium]|nr:hypothetical protein [Verrucomicrobiota bacterium]
MSADCVKNGSGFPKTAFLLGAGLGTRLRPLTENCPKPLLPLGGKPMICRAMDALIALGIKRFIINTHHAAEVYAEKFPGGNYRGVPVELVHEPVLLETGGGLKNIESRLSPDDKNLLVYNGDILADLDLKKLVAEHLRSRALATLLLRTDERGNVNFEEEKQTQGGKVADLRDRLGNAGTRRCKFTGIYCVSRKFFDEIPAGKIESVVEAFLRVIVLGNGEIRGIIDDAGTWRDLGTLAEYEAAQREFKI